MESSYREEGPAPLLWRSSDFKEWAQLCPVEPEVGHALMRLVISGRDIPHSCEVFGNSRLLQLLNTVIFS
jgi:spatacsin